METLLLAFYPTYFSLTDIPTLTSSGETAKEEPLFPSHEPRTPQDHPWAGRGLRRGERELRQRTQTQCGHHSPEVGLHWKWPGHWIVFFFFWMKLHPNNKCGPQGKGSLSRLSTDIADWAWDIHQSPASHCSHQTAEQQVSIVSRTNFSQTGHTLLQLKYVLFMPKYDYVVLILLLGLLVEALGPRWWKKSLW